MARPGKGLHAPKLKQGRCEATEADTMRAASVASASYEALTSTMTARFDRLRSQRFVHATECETRLAEERAAASAAVDDHPSLEM